MSSFFIKHSIICLLIFSLLIEKNSSQEMNSFINCARCHNECIYGRSALDCLLYQIFCTAKSTSSLQRDLSANSGVSLQDYGKSECDMLKGLCMYQHNIFACALYSIAGCK